jgi:hypothetical protein
MFCKYKKNMKVNPIQYRGYKTMHIPILTLAITSTALTFTFDVAKAFLLSYSAKYCNISPSGISIVSPGRANMMEKIILVNEIKKLIISLSQVTLIVFT